MVAVYESPILFLHFTKYSHVFFVLNGLMWPYYFLSAAYQALYNNDMYVCFQVLNKSVEIVVSTPRCLTRRRPVGHWRIWGQKSPSEFFKLGGSDVDGVLHTAPHDQPRCTQLREPQPPPSLLFVGICEIISAQIRPLSDVRPLHGEHRRKRPVATLYPVHTNMLALLWSSPASSSSTK